MKKIMIVTFTGANNHGAMLQAYALQTVLDNAGYEVEILNYQDENIEKVYKHWYFRSFSMLSFCIDIVTGFVIFFAKQKNIKVFRKFRLDYLKLSSRKYTSVEGLKKNPPDSDIYVAGSDQIWNLDITNGLSDVYTLNFVPMRKKSIAYAASAGTVENIINNAELFSLKLKRMDEISVREKSCRTALETLFPDKIITTVLDPTFLLTADQWMKLAKDDFLQRKEKYILVYFMSDIQDIKRGIVRKLSKITGYRILHFGIIPRYRNVLCSAYTADPRQFVSLFHEAEYVVTDSFHGTAFSVIFNKDFWVVPHKITGDRVRDLLSDLKLTDRIIQEQDDWQRFDLTISIDFKNVNKRLKQMRKSSLGWLMDALNC